MILSLLLPFVLSIKIREIQKCLLDSHKKWMHLRCNRKLTTIYWIVWNKHDRKQWNRVIAFGNEIMIYLFYLNDWKAIYLLIFKESSFTDSNFYSLWHEYIIILLFCVQCLAYLKNSSHTLIYINISLNLITVQRSFYSFDVIILFMFHDIRMSLKLIMSNIK